MAGEHLNNCNSILAPETSLLGETTAFQHRMPYLRAIWGPAFKIESLAGAMRFITEVLEEHPGAAKLYPELAALGFRSLEGLESELSRWVGELEPIVADEANRQAGEHTDGLHCDRRATEVSNGTGKAEDSKFDPALCDASDLRGLSSALETAWFSIAGTEGSQWIARTSEGRAMEFLIGDLIARTDKLYAMISGLRNADETPQPSNAGDASPRPAHQKALRPDLEAWRSGFQAGRDNAGQASCPYPADSVGSQSWDAGRIEGEAFRLNGHAVSGGAEVAT